MGVRRARADEWEALREIRLAALTDSPDAFGSTLAEERDADEARWRGWITGEGWAGDVATFIAEAPGPLLGMATGYRPDDRPTTGGSSRCGCDRTDVARGSVGTWSPRSMSGPPRSTSTNCFCT
jgi:hypothetical protein